VRQWAASPGHPAATPGTDTGTQLVVGPVLGGPGPLSLVVRWGPSPGAWHVASGGRPSATLGADGPESRDAPPWRERLGPGILMWATPPARQAGEFADLPRQGAVCIEFMSYE
jgi:hypothetical protein